MEHTIDYLMKHRNVQLNLAYSIQKLNDLDVKLCCEPMLTEHNRKTHNIINRIYSLYRKIKYRSIDDKMIELKKKLNDIVNRILNRNAINEIVSSI